MDRKAILDEILATVESIVAMEPHCDGNNYCMHCTYRDGKMAYVRNLIKTLKGEVS